MGPVDGSQRARIVAAAGELMAAHGAKGMTMRQLAAACELNIATLYHYFASKSELLGAIVAQRRYDAGLRDLTLPVDASLAPRPRLAAFLEQLATEAVGELRLWRLLVGESLRDDAVALAEARRLSSALGEAVDRWLGESFPELAATAGGPSRSEVASVVTGQLLAVFLEEMLLGEDGRQARLAQRAAATAAVVFPGPP
jgi:TetR/AcrR family transcriptional regulator, transcriptional repressor for nem operon